jgi:hypothetical protein
VLQNPFLPIKFNYKMITSYNISSKNVPFRLKA